MQYKNGWKRDKFRRQKNQQKTFYKNKKQFKIEDIDINKILLSRIESNGKKGSKIYFIGYNDDDVIKPLCIMLFQMDGYVKCFDGNKPMSFIVDDNKLLKVYIKIWEKLNSLIGKKFDSESVWGDKYINTKIKSYKDSVITNFRGEGNSKKVPKEDLPYKCLALIMLDSVIKTGKKILSSNASRRV